MLKEIFKSFPKKELKIKPFKDQADMSIIQFISYLETNEIIATAKQSRQWDKRLSQYCNNYLIGNYLITLSAIYKFPPDLYKKLASFQKSCKNFYTKKKYSYMIKGKKENRRKFIFHKILFYGLRTQKIALTKISTLICTNYSSVNLYMGDHSFLSLLYLYNSYKPLNILSYLVRLYYAVAFLETSNSIELDMLSSTQRFFVRNQLDFLIIYVKLAHYLEPTLLDLCVPVDDCSIVHIYDDRSAIEVCEYIQSLSEKLCMGIIQRLSINSRRRKNKK